MARRLRVWLLGVRRVAFVRPVGLNRSRLLPLLLLTVTERDKRVSLDRKIIKEVYQNSLRQISSRSSTTDPKPCPSHSWPDVCRSHALLHVCDATAVQMRVNRNSWPNRAEIMRVQRILLSLMNMNWRYPTAVVMLTCPCTCVEIL